MNKEQLTQWIRTLIKNNNIKAFYNSALWEHIREEVLQEQHHECQVCKANGLYGEGNTVHHIKFLREHPELALTKSNLMVVCKDCHYKIHHKLIPSVKPQLNKERW